MSATEAAPPDMQLPIRSRCGACYQWRNGGGYLTISPGSLTFEFDQFTRKIFRNLPKKIVHERQAVMVVRARLLPPVLWTGIVVCGEDSAVLATTSSLIQHPRIRKALVAAGFAIEDVSTWVSRGERLARDQTRKLRSMS